MGLFRPSMFWAASAPCRCAITQCSIRMRSPDTASGKRATSPAAKIPGTLVSSWRLTRIPSSTAMPALLARSVTGRTPIPTTTRSAGKSSPLVSVTVRRPMAAGRLPKRNATPCCSCWRRRKSATAGPKRRSMGRTSGVTTVTSIVRARSAAAASSPMKLAPTTTA